MAEIAKNHWTPRNKKTLGEEKQEFAKELKMAYQAKRGLVVKDTGHGFHAINYDLKAENHKNCGVFAW